MKFGLDATSLREGTAEEFDEAKCLEFSGQYAAERSRPAL